MIEQKNTHLSSPPLIGTPKSQPFAEQPWIEKNWKLLEKIYSLSSKEP